MVGRDGTELPCVTVGPLAPVAQAYCVRGTEKQGWVRKTELGWSGVTFSDDRHVASVAPGSPAAQAGLQPGDLLVSIDGQPAQPPAGEVARRLLFGPRGGAVALSVRRDGQTLARTFKRDAEPEPADAPRSPNPLLGVHPVMNWHGDFVPCMGAGLLGPAVVATCISQTQKRGFVKTDVLGATGLSFDPARRDVAAVATVTPGSAAASADIRPGDVVEAVDGRRLDNPPASDADALIFGRKGASHHVVAQRGGREVTADIVLGARP